MTPEESLKEIRRLVRVGIDGGWNSLGEMRDLFGLAKGGVK